MQKPAVSSDPLWIIDYESSQWCGGQSNVVVRAADADEAALKAEYHMDDEMRQLFADEYSELIAEEGEDADQDCAFTVNSIELFDENHDQWKFYLDANQRAAFYPTID